MTAPAHKHDFVETYQGLLAQGLDRGTDEATLAVYLQKISDDNLLKVLLPRLSDEDIKQGFAWIYQVLKANFSQEEYHRLFLKNPSEHGSRQM